MRAFLERHDVACSAPTAKPPWRLSCSPANSPTARIGITVATVQQMRVCHRFGVRRVLMANQLIGRQAIHEVLSGRRGRPRTLTFYCLVDSVDGVRLA